MIPVLRASKFTLAIKGKIINFWFFFNQRNISAVFGDWAQISAHFSAGTEPPLQPAKLCDLSCPPEGKASGCKEAKKAGRGGHTTRLTVGSVAARFCFRFSDCKARTQIAFHLAASLGPTEQDKSSGKRQEESCPTCTAGLEHRGCHKPQLMLGLSSPGNEAALRPQSQLLPVPLALLPVPLAQQGLRGTGICW